MKQFVLAALRGYKRWISPWLPVACRYVPTCSEYAMEAVEVHGAARGSLLALRRLARCHPFGGHGVDQVPRKYTVRRARFSENGSQISDPHSSEAI